MPKARDCKSCLFFGGVHYISKDLFDQGAFHHGFVIQCNTGGFGYSAVLGAVNLGFNFHSVNQEHVNIFFRVNGSARVACRHAPSQGYFDPELIRLKVSTHIPKFYGWRFDQERQIFRLGECITKPKYEQVTIFDMAGVK